MPVPEDDPGELRAAFYLFTAIGIGYLFPFSALTQPVDYWSILFPDFNIEFPLTAVYMWVNLVVLFALVFVGGQPVYKRRIYGGFLGQLAALLIVPSSWFFHFSEKVNFVIVMGSTLLAAVVTAFIDSCAISFSAQVRPLVARTDSQITAPHRSLPIICSLLIYSFLLCSIPPRSSLGCSWESDSAPSSGRSTVFLRSWCFRTR